MFKLKKENKNWMINKDKIWGQKKCCNELFFNNFHERKTR